MTSLGASDLPSWETSYWSSFSAVLGACAPQSSSISRPVETTSFARVSNRARIVRCLGPPSGIGRPWSKTVIGPRIRNSMIPPDGAHSLPRPQPRLSSASAPELALDDRFRDRFARESEVAMSLEHPNVVPIYDAGDIDGRLYLAIRLVEGTDLRALLRGEGPLEPASAH